jgi:fatty acid desaturase
MKIWKHSRLDFLMLALSIGQFLTTLVIASVWDNASTLVRAASFLLLVVMTVYNIIVVSHLFTHANWFRQPLLNRLVSMLNSINIGQSVQAYELIHVRNHHRYNNDQKWPDGQTRDLSSTFRAGVDGEHAGLFRYAFVGAAETMMDLARSLGAITRLWRAGAHEQDLLALFARS